MASILDTSDGTEVETVVIPDRNERHVEDLSKQGSKSRQCFLQPPLGGADCTLTCWLR